MTSEDKQRGKIIDELNHDPFWKRRRTYGWVVAVIIILLLIWLASKGKWPVAVERAVQTSTGEVIPLPPAKDLPACTPDSGQRYCSTDTSVVKAVLGDTVLVIGTGKASLCWNAYSLSSMEKKKECRSLTVLK